MTSGDAHFDVIVVGGGVAGLMAALQSARDGRRTLLLEAAEEVGGCVRFHTVAGLRLDRGAESFATARDGVGRLVADLDLAVQPPAAGPAWIYHRRGAAPIPAATLLGIPAHPAAPDVRRLIGWPGVIRAAWDRAAPPGRPPAGLGELVGRRLGRRVLDRLVAPVVSGVYSADPAGLDVDAVAPGLREAMGAAGGLAAAVGRLRGHGPASGSAALTIVGGMGLLSSALACAAAAAGTEIRCRAPVSAIMPANEGWALRVHPDAPETPDGQAAPTSSYPRQTLTADRVVIAVPAAKAADLVAQATDGHAVLHTAPPTPVEVVTLVVDEPRLDGNPRGTGLLVAPDVTDVGAKALTHATAKWPWLARAAGPGRHVLRLSYGRGAALPGAEAFPDLALSDAGALLGVPLGRRQLVDHAVIRFTGQLAARRADQREALAAFVRRLDEYPGLDIRGSAIAGTGLGAVVADATAHRLVDAPTRRGRIEP